MSKERLSMRKIKEVLRLKLACGLSNRQIASSCNVSRTTTADYIRRAKIAGIVDWCMVEGMSEGDLENKFFVLPKSNPVSPVSLPDYAKIHEELRNKSVTLMLLWNEYKNEHPDGYQYTRFVHYYNEYRGKLDLVMRQDHHAGEKLFVDYSGKKPSITNLLTGKETPVELFVAVWGASNYTYTEATYSQNIALWTGSHVRAFEYFERVPHVIVLDNLKSGIHHACRYEPDINPTYQEMATHYGFAVIPTRVRHPRDKAKAEVGVQVAQRWILAALRHRRFFSLGELNQAIWELLENLNTRPMRKLKKSRREVFDQLDKPNALPLPERHWEYAEWKKPKVNIDYHIDVDHHYYSVPCSLVHKVVDVRITSNIVEVFFKGNRVASHLRSYEKYKATTLSEHMPSSHRQYAEWTPSRIINWAGKTGSSTAELVQRIMESKQHPEQGYRAALGILRLARTYGDERVENACSRAVTYRTYKYKSVRSILANGLDRNPTVEKVEQSELPWHNNIRGSDYYKKTKEEENLC